MYLKTSHLCIQQQWRGDCKCTVRGRTEMSPKNKITLFVLSMAVVALTGFSLSAQHSKQIIDALASAVWGS
jgi:hypothetical protein